MHDVGCLLEGPTPEPTSPAACFRKFRQGIDARQLRPGTGGAAPAERLHNAARPPPSPPSRSATAPSRLTRPCVKAAELRIAPPHVVAGARPGCLAEPRPPFSSHAPP